MPGDPLPLPGAVHGMVAELVTGLAAGWTRSVGGVNWVAKAMSECHNKLSWLKLQAETWRRHNSLLNVNL